MSENDKSDSPILVIDSGLGGVSILNALQKKLPSETFIYFADYAFLPYGEKTEKEIERRCFEIVNIMESEKPKAVVLACNSATASAIKALRKAFTLEFFGTEPGIKPAAQTSIKGIAVLATALTLKSEQFANLLTQYAKQAPVFSLPAPELVSLVESAQWNTQEGKELIVSTLNKINHDFDTLLLGCTHFAFLKEQLQEVLGSGVRIIDTSEAIATRVLEKLKLESLLCSASEALTKVNLVISSIEKSELSTSSDIDINRVEHLKSCLSKQFVLQSTQVMYS